MRLADLQALADEAKKPGTKTSGSIPLSAPQISELLDLIAKVDALEARILILEGKRT